MAELLESTATRLHLSNAAATSDEAVRKGEFDTALAAKSGTAHTHAQLHDAVTTAAGDGTVSLSLTGQQLSASVSLATNSGLASSSGLKVNFGTDAGTVSEGNHTHANDHVAATVSDTDTIDLTISGQAISGAVKLATNGGLKSVAGAGGGVAADVGTSANQVSAGNHTHAAVDGSNAGFMTPAMLATLNSLGAASSLTVADTNSVNITYASGQLKADVVAGSGLEIDSNGLRVDWDEVPAKTHVHPVVGGIGTYAVTNLGTGYTSPPTVAVSGNGTDATATSLIGAVGVTIAAAGTGFTLNDVIQITGDLAEDKIRVTVTAVNGSGAITGVSVANAGQYDSAIPSNPVAFSGGTGTGATLNITWGVTAVLPDDYGYHYTEATVAFSGGGGSGAAATASAWLVPGFASLSDIWQISTNKTAIYGLQDDMLDVQQKLTGNILDYGMVYLASPWVIPVTAGHIYEYTHGANETSLTNGVDVLTASAQFTAAGASISLLGVEDALVTASIVDVTALQTALNVQDDLTTLTDLDPSGGIERTGSGLSIAPLPDGAGSIPFTGGDDYVASDPGLQYDDTAKALAVSAYASVDKQTVSLTANNQTVTPTKSVIEISSDNATPANRVFKLAAPPRYGWVLELQWVGTNAGKLVNGSNVSSCYARLDADWIPAQYGSITLFWNGTDYIEKSRKGTPTSVLSGISSNGVVVRSAADTYVSRQITSANGDLVVTNPTGAAGDIDIKLAPAGMETVAYASSVAVDMDGEAFKTINLTGNIALSTANRGAGKSVQVRLVADSTERNVTLAAGIRTYGAVITSVPANKELLISLTSFGSSESDTRAAFGPEA